MLKTTACICSTPCFTSFKVENMSLEEKVGQVIMAHFNGDVANEDARILIQESKIGGVIYYNWSNGLKNPRDVQNLSLSLQELTQSNRVPIPLLIAVDQEGGSVSRLKNGFTKFPGNAALGETCDSNLAEKAAFTMGQEMQAVGINMNLAPVVDINSNPNNPVIGNRSFGKTVEIVVNFGQKVVDGYNKAGIIATLKHFPGHGDTDTDSHKDLPIINRSIEELELVELVPFAKLKADAIMTAHILAEALDSENCATLSFKTLNYLKETLKFKGVIISDSLVMEGVLKNCQTVAEAAIQALEAGCDILLLGGKQIRNNSKEELSINDVTDVHAAILKAVKEDPILELRLNQATQKVLILKSKYLCVSSSLVRQEIDRLVNTPDHQEVAATIQYLLEKI